MQNLHLIHCKLFQIPPKSLFSALLQKIVAGAKMHKYLVGLVLPSDTELKYVYTLYYNPFSYVNCYLKEACNILLQFLGDLYSSIY